MSYVSHRFRVTAITMYTCATVARPSQMMMFTVSQSPTMCTSSCPFHQVHAPIHCRHSAVSSFSTNYVTIWCKAWLQQTVTYSALM